MPCISASRMIQEDHPIAKANKSPKTNDAIDPHIAAAIIVAGCAVRCCTNIAVRVVCISIRLLRRTIDGLHGTQKLTLIVIGIVDPALGEHGHLSQRAPIAIMGSRAHWPRSWCYSFSFLRTNSRICCIFSCTIRSKSSQLSVSESWMIRFAYS